MSVADLRARMDEANQPKKRGAYCEGSMTFWRHMLWGSLIIQVPFLVAFAVSAFTPWDALSQVMGSIYWAAFVCLFGIFWIALFFVRRRNNSS